jgi:hypothetical protein
MESLDDFVYEGSLNSIVGPILEQSREESIIIEPLKASKK